MRQFRCFGVVLQHLAVLIGFLLIPTLGIVPSWADTPAVSPSGQFKAIDADWKAEQKKCFAAVETAKTEDDRRNAWKIMPDPEIYSRRMLSAAESKPDDAGARDALLWIVDRPGGSTAHHGAMAEVEQRAVELLLQHHADDLEVARVAMRLNNIPSGNRDTLLEGLVAKAVSRNTKALARVALAQYLMKKADAAEAFQRQELKPKSTDTSGRVEAYQAYIRPCDFAVTRRKADGLLEEVISQYGDVTIMRTGRAEVQLGKFAESLVDELRDLGIGKPSPNIDSVDLNGKPLKLSDYRGKVVLLVFWASWCGPCVDEIPRERELVERLKGRPFALLGVNGDEDKAAAQKVIESEKVNWLNWNDPLTTDGDGPIVDRFHVHEWPSTFLIDADGIIRAKNETGKELDEAIDALLVEVESPDDKQ